MFITHCTTTPGPYSSFHLGKGCKISVQVESQSTNKLNDVVFQMLSFYGCGCHFGTSFISTRFLCESQRQMQLKNAFISLEKGIETEEAKREKENEELKKEAMRKRIFVSIITVIIILVASICICLKNEPSQKEGHKMIDG